MDQSLLECEKNIRFSENSMAKAVLPSDADQLKVKWQRQVANAKILWGEVDGD